MFSGVLILVALASSSLGGGTVRVHDSDGLRSTLEQLDRGTTIVLEPGSYVIDNPAAITTDGVALVGIDRDMVLLSPRNAGKPIFDVDADDFHVRSLIVDGALPREGMFASFAIYFRRGVAGCLLADAVLRNFQATAVVGYDVTRCSIEDSLIFQTAGDGVLLRGEQISVRNNLVHTVFDEPLDLEGRNVIVRGNRIAFGRIGITVNSVGQSEVSENIVVTQYEEGIVFASSGAGLDVLSNNIVSGAGIRSYQINQLQDESRLLMRQNIACRDGVPTRELTTVGDSIIKEEKNNFDCASAEWSELIGIEEAVDRDMPWASTFVATADMSSIEVAEAENDTDRRAVVRMAAQLQHLNPGVLTLRVSGPTAHSAVTPSLGKTLSTSPAIAVNPIRWPFLNGSGVRQWILSVDGQEQVLISRKPDGSRVRITAMQSGEMAFLDRVLLFWDRVRFKVRRVKSELADLF